MIIARTPRTETEGRIEFFRELKAKLKTGDPDDLKDAIRAIEAAIKLEEREKNNGNTRS